MLTQVALEATPGQQSGIVAVGCNEDERAGFPIGRAGRVYEHAHRNGVAGGALAIEQRKKRAQ